MCGIVGLYLKDPSWRPRLGVHLGAMLIELSERGPDSAGIAVYRDPVGPGMVKLTLFRSAGTQECQSANSSLPKSGSE